MLMNRRFRFPSRRALSLAALASFLSLAIAAPSQAWFYDYYDDANDAEDFDNCADALLRSGLPEEQVAIACAEALVPEELSSCVSDIAEHTPVEANFALFACFRSRRPVELANCTIDINRETIDPYYTSNVTESAASAREALDRCRRSLLPERYAACVVGLSRQDLALAPPEAMSVCLEAEDFPRELYTPATNAEPQISE